MARKYKVGDLFILADDTPCIVMKINEQGKATKIKAVVKEDRLLGMGGFFIEGDDYVMMELAILANQN